MSDSELLFLGEQVRKLSMRVTALESQVAELRQVGHHGPVADFELVSEAHALRVPMLAAALLCTIIWLLRFLLVQHQQFNCVPIFMEVSSLSRKRAWAKFVVAGRISKPRPTTPIDLAASPTSSCEQMASLIPSGQSVHLITGHGLATSRATACPTPWPRRRRHKSIAWRQTCLILKRSTDGAR